MASVRQVSASLAKVAVAVVFTGPVGGLREAGGQAIDLFLRDAGTAKDRLTPLLRRVEAGLAAFAAGEGLAEDAVTRAMGNAETIIARHGLTAAELAGAGLDPVRAVAILVARADQVLRQLDEADAALCRRAISEVYSVLVEQVAADPDVTVQYRREVLRRLEAIEALPRAVAELLGRARAHDVVTDPARRWSRELYPSSALLRPEYGVVPFWGRDDMIADVEAWAADAATARARLYVGAGGMGKTRLMMEVCGRLRVAGWRAGFLRDDTPVTAEQLDVLGGGARGVAVVVDYGETRTPVVARLVDAGLAAATPVRILLLARSTGDWWERLRQLPDAVGDFLSGPAASVHVVPALATDPQGRAEVYRHGMAAFARALGGADATAPDPDGHGGGALAAEAYDRVLFLLIKALATVEGERVDGGRALLDYALRREQRFWDDGMRESGLPALAGRPIRQAAALATLAGSARSFDDAVGLLRAAPLLHDQPAAVLGRVAELLHRLYPAETWLSGVQPDLLGEHLVARVIEDDPAVLAVFGGA